MALKDRPLARDIVLVLAIKVVAIALIWGVFFNPGTRADVGPAVLGSHLLPAPDATR